MPMPWEEQDPDWWKGEVDEAQNTGSEKSIEGLEGLGEPVIVDEQIWGIAKRVKVPTQDTEQATRLVYWATVVKLYREMGGRFEFRPTPD